MSGSISASTAAMISIGMTAAGGVMSAVGQSQQANAAASSAAYQAGMMRNREVIAEKNAQDAIQRGQVAEQQQRLKTAQIIGGQRAALASQGGDVNSGSPLDIQSDTAGAGEQDALTIRSNAAREAYNYKVQGESAGAQAGLLDMQFANATAALPFTIGSTLLGTASSVGSKYAMWQYRSGKPGVSGDTIPFSTDI
jgi:hypothetical protein